ncbi:MAG: aminotransferase class I/II-fold pyridoxal phosphate-dependent enzyme [Treponema sp.]|jgi:histidinol-phosphate aminotransferase|nr:aminotransferase class I/II-fold pyridoxal phosphate-dependent enzyme [Treponema sp.]
MSRYWNSRVKGLDPYIPGEQPRDRKFIKLNTNENPYPPSPRVGEAVRQIFEGDGTGEELRLYSDPACTDLRTAAAAYFGLRPEQIFAGNGSDEALAFAFAAFFESRETPVGAAILFPDISYSFYPVYARLWNVPFTGIPLTADFSINPDDYRQPSAGVIFPNPNAPTGRSLESEAILSLAAYLETRGKVLIVDEAYIAFGGESVVPALDDHPNLLVIQTLSKSASLAGLRVGFALGHPDLIEGLCRIRDSFNSYTLDRLAQAGAAAAMHDTAYYAGINGKIRATRERVSSALGELGFTVIPSQANFIFARPPRISGSVFFSRLRERGILVRRFNKERIADYLRISMGTDGEMDIFLEACGNILREEK